MHIIVLKLCYLSLHSDGHQQLWYGWIKSVSQPLFECHKLPIPNIHHVMCVRPVTTLTKSAGWLYGSRGRMQIRGLTRKFGSKVTCDGFSFSCLVTSFSPLSFHIFAISWANLLHVSILYAHRFMVSDFRVMLMISCGPCLKRIHVVSFYMSDSKKNQAMKEVHENRDPPTFQLLCMWRRDFFNAFWCYSRPTIFSLLHFLHYNCLANLQAMISWLGEVPPAKIDSFPDKFYSALKMNITSNFFGWKC